MHICYLVLVKSSDELLNYFYKVLQKPEFFLENGPALCIIT